VVKKNNRSDGTRMIIDFADKNGFSFKKSENHLNLLPKKQHFIYSSMSFVVKKNDIPSSNSNTQNYLDEKQQNTLCQVSEKGYTIHY
jgi:hypothetical protein